MDIIPESEYPFNPFLFILAVASLEAEICGVDLLTPCGYTYGHWLNFGIFGLQNARSVADFNFRNQVFVASTLLV